MCSIIGETRPRARKEHTCSALSLIYDCGLREIMPNLSSKDKKTLASLIRHDGKIQKGEVYRSYSIVDGGDIQSFKESLIATQICVDFDLYDTWC